MAIPFFSDSFEKPVKVAIQLLQLLKVPVTNDAVNESIFSHPDYPSLLSISDGLQQWNVDNAALRVEKEKLDELPVPFIAYVDGDFRVITQVTADALFYLDDEDRVKSESRDEFLHKWAGVALIAEAMEGAGDREYAAKKKKKKINSFAFPSLLLAMGLMVLIGSFTFATNYDVTGSAGYILLSLCKLAGVIVTGLLLWYEIDKFNPVLQKICRGNSGKSNCNAVLNSPGARLLPFISWSELGFFYFTGGFLSLVLQPYASAVHTLAVLNLLALPYVVFSIYYQWRVAKQWCRLCLAVQALLVSEFIISFAAGFIFSGNFPVLPGVGIIALLAVHFMIPLLGWYFIKPHLQDEKEGRIKKYELARLKSNPDIFHSMLQKQKKVTRNTEGLGIVLGNPSATHTIIKVCNPYCAPCAKAHPEIEQLLHENDNLKVQVIFTTTTAKDDNRAQPVRHLMAIADKNDKQLTVKAMEDWYLPENKDYNVFAAKYPMNGELDKQEEKLESMYKWCNENGIEFTPTFFFDGYQLPEMYRITDLKFFLAGERFHKG